jgi:hypothetical protein
MSLCVLFGLLFCCLACFREGVWTKYTPQDVARWHAQAAVEVEALPMAAKAHPPVRAAVISRSVPAARREAREVRVAETVG